jgi:hypothetical protein
MYKYSLELFRMNKNLSAIALALSALALHTTASANLVQNGSFEDVSPAAGVQTQAPGTWSVYSALDGWATTSGSGIEVRNAVAGTASNGGNYVELDSFGNSTMAQTILTTVGAYYTLSFDYSPRIGVAANSNGIDVLWNNTLVNLSPITASGIGLGNHAWTNFVFGVVGTGSDVLSFRSVGTSDSLGGSLDNVRLVPEPGMLASFAVGLAALGLVSKRRRGQG